MKKLWNGFKIAFSMYSKIPMPKSQWTEENMGYALCFFPLVGVPIGACTLLWRHISQILGLRGSAASAIVLMLIPVVLTGGIHLDGLLDTADALGSYGEPKKRLEILKDSRAGAFAVIQAVVYFFSYYGVYSYLDLQAENRAWHIIALSFVLSRALSGYGVVAFPGARETGLLASFSHNARKRTVKIVMGVFVTAAALCMGMVSPVSMMVVYVLSFGVFIYYYQMSKKKFGGITGDLAGWFLQKCELVMAFGVMAVQLLLN